MYWVKQISCSHTHAHTCTHLQVCMHVHMQACMHVHTYTRTQTQTHTYTPVLFWEKVGFKCWFTGIGWLRESDFIWKGVPECKRKNVCCMTQMLTDRMHSTWLSAIFCAFHLSTQIMSVQCAIHIWMWQKWFPFASAMILRKKHTVNCRLTVLPYPTISHSSSIWLFLFESNMF